MPVFKPYIRLIVCLYLMMSINHSRNELWNNLLFKRLTFLNSIQMETQGLNLKEINMILCMKTKENRYNIIHELTVNLYESPIFYRECTNGLSSESKRPLVNYPFSTLITDHNELCLNCIDTDVLQDIPCIRAFTSFYGD